MKPNLAIALAAGMLAGALPALAGPREQAYSIYTRLNGLPPTPEKLAEIEGFISRGELRNAAVNAIDSGFYNVILRNMVAPWTSETQQVRVDLNDSTATVIGMVRDEIPFNQILSGDIVYVGVDPTTPLPEYSVRRQNINGQPPYNGHYVEIDRRNLRLEEVLVKRKQSEMSTFLTAGDTAGFLTTWGFAKEYYQMGTNRAAVRFTLMSFLCQDMEQFSDTARPDFRVRQDVTRTPGGDSSVFKNKCQGCHAGMDGMAGAFAYLDYTDQVGLIYNPGAYNNVNPNNLGDTNQIPGKYLRNLSEFPDGFATVDDSWILLWHEGANEGIGWNGRKSGRGVKSWGEMIASTDRFSTCMATHALQTICNVDGQTTAGKMAINQLANSFRAKGRYNMKNMFAQAALMCRGE